MSGSSSLGIGYGEQAIQGAGNTGRRIALY